jgi:ubiquitin-protein ligase
MTLGILNLTKRIMKEKILCMRNENFDTIWDDTNPNHFYLRFKVDHGIYVDQIHILDIDLSLHAGEKSQFPVSHPTMRFKSNIYHPNVYVGGNICLDTITSSKWEPSTKIENLYFAIVLLLQDVNVSSPANSDCATTFNNMTTDEFTKTALTYYKKGLQNNPQYEKFENDFPNSDRSIATQIKELANEITTS